MNKEEMPQTVLETNSKGGMEICDQADSEENVLQADLNENKLNNDDEHCLMRKEEAKLQIKDAQDSINNNNEACNMMCGQLSCKKGCEDNDLTVMDSLTTTPHPHRENAVNKGKRLCSKRSTRSKKNNGKSTGLSTAVDINFSEENYFVGCVNEQTTPDSDVSPENRSQKQLRDSLFSIIREGLKPTEDLKMLPSYLHKIAETYFLEENYEKAMRFIQLEREYHEQLLANLSSIQKQWETKWKRAKSTSLLSTHYSEKDLSSEEFERLSNICSSHQHPQTAEWKFSVSEKPLTVQSLHQLTRTAGTHGVDGPHPVFSDRECDPDIRTTIDRKPGVAAMTDNLPADVRSADSLTRGADNQALLSHCEEQQMSIFGATLEIHTLPIGTSDRANLDSNITSGDAGKNNSLLQQGATTNSRDAAEIETFSKEGVGERTGSPMIDKLISVPTIQSDSVLERSHDVTEGRSSSECTCPADTTTGDVAAIINQIINADNKVNELQQSPDYSAAQTHSEERNSRAQHQAAVEFIASLLNSNLKDSEDFLAHLEFQEEIVSEEEMSPSSGESVLGDNFISLDELAKRIEIEEVNPAAGLVSILKKRNDSEGDKPSQSLQKQAKRKVRFQEAEDALDQEELGGGSCILLIALCIATVFLSIGGTALYCTFGDLDSSVCKDFAANVDFYYTQTVQGIEELRHWLFIT